MNHGQTKNPQEFSDLDRIEDCIGSQKMLTEAYNSMTSDCVSDQLRRCFLQNLKEEHEIHAQLFQAARERGWMQTNDAAQAEILKIKQQYAPENI